jgi:UDP-N-acetylglucosamine 2-epimerase
VRVVTIVGNRPQFVKAAAVSAQLRARHDEVLVHSGQHYDDELSAIFFRELDLPAPDRELGIGSGTNVQQVTSIMQALESVVPELGAHAVLVYGDTNTTLAGALSSDHLSELLLCSTQTAVDNLTRESIDGGIRLVGDVMADITLSMLPVAESKSDALERLGLEPGSYLLVTAHRAGNVDADEPLGRLVAVLEALPMTAIFAIHPRTRMRLDATGALMRLESAEHVVLTPPLGYLEFLQLLRNAAAVLTDSGGVQKEAYLLRVPCLTLRDRTEWVETVELGWNRLVALDPERVVEALGQLDPPAAHPELYGGGRAGERVVEAIGDWASARGLDG